jgi:8-oxo-dGTP diphosphatase
MKNATVLVGGIISQKGKVLLLKRAMTKKFLPGYWDLPGGKVEFGEEPDEAIIRESREETGLDVHMVEPYNAWSYVAKIGNKMEHCTEIDYIMQLKGRKKITLSPDEHSEFKWFGKDELPAKMSKQLKKTVLKAFIYI